MTAPFLLLPAAGYLAVVCGLLLGLRRCPVWVHPLAVLGLAPIRIATSGLGGALLPILAAAALLIPAVVVGRRMLSGVGLFSTVVTVGLLPLSAWWMAGVGIGLAGVTAAVRTFRGGGTARVGMLAADAFAAAGMSPAGWAPPDLHRLPARADLPPVRATGEPHRLHLPPYLLAGLVAAAVVTTTLR